MRFHHSDVPGCMHLSMRATAGALALAPGVSPLLDPVENKSNGGGDGRYRRQYQEHARTTAWGTEKQGCGCGTLVRAVDGRLQVMPLLCDMFGCGLCGPKRAAWLKREVGQAVFRYKLRYFWTLTIDTKSCTPDDSYGLVTASFDRLRAVLRKHYGRFSYVWVMESTKRGYAHLHLLVSIDVPHAEISARWASATGGSYIVDVQSIGSDKAANYITKYCAQQATARGELHNGRLYRKHVFGKSQDVQFAPFRPAATAAPDGATQSEWYRWRMPYKDALVLLQDVGTLTLNKQDKTPYAILNVPPDFEVEATCERLREAYSAEQGAWAEPDPLPDDGITAELDGLAVRGGRTSPVNWDAYLGGVGIGTRARGPSVELVT